MENIGTTAVDIVTTWVDPGVHLAIIDYSLEATDERIDTIMLYDHTLISSIGYAETLYVKGVHRDIIVKCINIPKGNGAHQISVQALAQGGVVLSRAGAQLQIITLRSFGN